MPGVNKFAKLTNVDSALQSLFNICQPIERTIEAGLEDADCRVLSADIASPRDFPHYDLCQVDGYAVRARDTAGCREGSEKTLRPSAGDTVGDGTYQRVHTGGALPAGADAVIKAEDTDPAAEGVVIPKELKAGENVTARGSVLRKGDIVYKAGTQLKPTDIGLLGKLGLTRVELYEKPRVLVIPTGDELLERGKEPGPGVINEGNGLMCCLLVKRYGGDPVLHDIVRDDLVKLEEALVSGLPYDLIVTSGGTSVGVRDRIEESVSAVGKVLVHGVGLKPGRPMGIGYVEGQNRRTPVLFLPGVTEACAATTLTFAVPAVRRLGHYPVLHPRKEKVILTKDMRGFPGAKAFNKVRVDNGRATPVLMIGESSAYGEYAYAIVPEDVDSYRAGDVVESIYLE